MKHLLLTALSTAFLSVAAFAQTAHPWMHIYHQDKNFNTYKLEDISTISHTCSGDMFDAMTVEGTDGSAHTILLSDVQRIDIGSNVPTIYINLTDFPEMNDLVDKDTYLNATITIDGNGLWDDITDVSLKIKGRGNTTWRYSKKPYRFKFGSKISLFGMKKSKNYAVIANYIDCSLMRNAFALEAAARLGMPYTNSVHPVRVFFNGINKGAYFVTEKIGINSASVDIDENTGILFELDTHFDEPYKFRSPYFKLPVMVKDPDFDELAEADGITPEERLAVWQADFEAFEKKVYDGEDWSDMVDMASFVDYLIVFNICGNHELIHPKSCYIHKKSLDDKYHFGPAWDFDWAFTYAYDEVDDCTGFPLDPDPGQNGGYFMIQMCKHPDFMPMYKARWEYFKTEILPGLIDYLDEYADIIEPSAVENGVLWPAVPHVTAGSYDFRTHAENLKAWIKGRAEFIDSHPTCGLYDPDITIVYP